MNGREKEYCYQTEKERESVVVEEKKMISSSKSVQGFPVAPHKTLSPPSEPPPPPSSPATAYLHTHTLFLFAQFTCGVFNGCCGLMQMCLLGGFVFAPQDIIIRTQVSGCNKLIRQ